MSKENKTLDKPQNGNDFIADVNLCANCGVPGHIHNTCCGWDNASLIIKEGEPLIAAMTGEEKKQRWLDSQHRG